MKAKQPARYIVTTDMQTFNKKSDPYRVVDTTTNQTIDQYASKRAAQMHANSLNKERLR